MGDRQRTAEEEAEYIADHYGSCIQRRECICLKPEHPWMGTFCPNWQPGPWKTFEEMREALKKK